MRYRFGEWVLDSDLYELRHADHSVKIEPKVFNVLTYLVEHHDRVISKQELFEHLWPGQHIGASALERCITSARKALGDNGDAQRIIRTLHGRGYRFVAHVEAAEPQRALLPEGRDSASAPTSQMTPALRLVGAASRRPQVVNKRKLVTALAGGLGNALALAEELGTEAMHDLLDRLFQLGLSQVGAVDGRIIHFVDDGFLALFGLSDSGLETALEAARAAVELQYLWSDDLNDRGVIDTAAHLRLGLHTGMITERKVGVDQRDVYMPVGDTIYLARALQRHAEPGTILASETTYRRVQDEAYGAIAGLMPIEAKATSAVTYSIFGFDDMVMPQPYLLPSAP